MLYRMIFVLVLMVVNPSFAHQWESSETRCVEIENKLNTATNLDPRLMHEYIEGCDLSKIPSISNKAVDSMTDTINRELLKRGLQPVENESIPR